MNTTFTSSMRLRTMNLSSNTLSAIWTTTTRGPTSAVMRLKVQFPINYHSCDQNSTSIFSPCMRSRQQSIDAREER